MGARLPCLLSHCTPASCKLPRQMRSCIINSHVLLIVVGVLRCPIRGCSWYLASVDWVWDCRKGQVVHPLGPWASTHLPCKTQPKVHPSLVSLLHTFASIAGGDQAAPCPRVGTVGFPTCCLCGAGRLCLWGVEGCQLLGKYPYGSQYLCSWKLPFILLQEGCDF